MARYTGDQDPTLFDLIEAGADDNVDLILAQLFTDDDLDTLSAALNVAIATKRRAAEAATECASIWGQRAEVRDEAELMAAEATECAERFAALLRTVEGG